MKNLKDCLHLYLGCECLTPDGIMILNGINTTDARYPIWFHSRWSDKKLCYLPKQNIEILGKQSLVGKAYKYSEIKPILRPLSDMTEKEAIECGNLDYDFSDDPENKWSWKDFDTLNSTKQFLFLLSKHFDLFGLIDEGLALDKTTLKIPA